MKKLANKKKLNCAKNEFPTCPRCKLHLSVYSIVSADLFADDDDNWFCSKCGVNYEIIGV